MNTSTIGRVTQLKPKAFTNFAQNLQGVLQCRNKYDLHLSSCKTHHMNIWRQGTIKLAYLQHLISVYPPKNTGPSEHLDFERNRRFPELVGLIYWVIVRFGNEMFEKRLASKCSQRFQGPYPFLISC